MILADACFSYDTPCCLAFNPAFACCRGTRESGSAPPNRRASEVRCKTPEINLRRPPLVDLSLQSLARLKQLGANQKTIICFCKASTKLTVVRRAVFMGRQGVSLP